MKRTILRCSLAAAIAMGSLPALAADAGSPSRYDHRIRTVEYNPMDTVKVDGVAGIATHIQVAPSERYVTHAFGESGGWAFSNVENNFFIRPKAVDSNTNLTIITDKRTYHFLLRYIDSYTIEENGQEVEKFIEVPWTMRAATVGVRFEYPFEDAQEEHQEQERQRIQEALNERDPQGPVNMQYRMSNDPESQEIAPVNAWDDYTHTYFKFPETRHCQPSSPLTPTARNRWSTRLSKVNTTTSWWCSKSHGNGASAMATALLASSMMATTRRWAVMRMARLPRRYGVLSVKEVKNDTGR